MQLPWYFWIIYLGVYLFFAYCLVVISQKTGRGTSWWGWVPILNVLLMLQIAGKPMWWIVLMLIPIVNFVIFIIVWLGILEARGKPKWIVILLFVPLVNIGVLPYIAFAD